MARKSDFESFVDVMSKIPWWLNIILAIIAYSILHSIAMTFHDPAPKLEIGQLGQYTADKMKGSLALFGQIIIPFGFILAGLAGLIKKFKRTGQYKELIFYIIINILFFGSVISKEGSMLNAITKRMQDDRKPQIVQNQISVEKHTNESGNELKVQQVIVKKVEEKQSGKQQNQKMAIYSWINDKGQKEYSNIGFPKDGKYTDGKIEMQ